MKNMLNFDLLGKNRSSGNPFGKIRNSGGKSEKFYPLFGMVASHSSINLSKKSHQLGNTDNQSPDFLHKKHRKFVLLSHTYGTRY
jgi:hypothetical protein